MAKLEGFIKRYKEHVEALWEERGEMPFHYVLHLPDGSTTATVLINGFDPGQTPAQIRAAARTEGANYVAVIYEGESVIHPDDAMTDEQMDKEIAKYGGIEHHPWSTGVVMMNVQTRNGEGNVAYIWIVNKSTNKLLPPERVVERCVDNEEIIVFPKLET